MPNESSPFTLSSQRKRPLSSSEKVVSTDKKYCSPAVSRNLFAPAIESETHTAFDMAKQPVTLEQVMSELAKLNKGQIKIQGEVSKIGQIQEDVSDLKANLIEYRTSLEFCHQQLSDAVEEIDVLREKVSQIDRFKSEIDELKSKNLRLENKILYMEAYSRRENLIFEGVAPKRNENCMQEVLQILSNLGLKDIRLQRCHRLNYQNLTQSETNHS